MKSHEEIKKGLECCVDGFSCRTTCPYTTPFFNIEKCTQAMAADALAYIQQLEAENERTMISYDAAMCEAADSAAMVQRWICVKDQLPEVRESVAIIVRDEDDEYLRIGWINSQREWHTVGGCVDGTVTQWLRIPDWPEVKGV